MRVSEPPRNPNPFDLPEAGILSDPQVREVLRKTRASHWHWDRFRFTSLPEEVSHAHLWNYVRLQRNLGLQRLPINDEEGMPFRFCVPPLSHRLISQIDRESAGSILSDNKDLPSRDRFVISSLMEEAIASSLLEGAQTTRVVAKKMLREGRKPKNRSERMIQNNWRVMEHILLLQSQPFSLELLLQIHRIVTQETLDNPEDCGRLRKRNDIAVVDAVTGEIAHQPPPFSLLPQRLESLARWVNDDEGEWIHPIVKASLLHFFIGYEHPFVDGNGRTARAVFYWFMLSRGYWLFEYLSISRFFLRAPVQYARAYLQVETDENDATYFVSHSLRVIELALRDMKNYLAQQGREKEEKIKRHLASDLEIPLTLNKRQRELLLHAIEHPKAIYSFALHQNTHGVAYQSARTDLLGLEAQGFLEKRAEGKKFIFVPVPDLIDKIKIKNPR